MTRLILIVLLFIPIKLFSQGYNSLYIGRLKDYENKIFVHGRVFSYNYSVAVGDTVGKIELSWYNNPNLKGRRILDNWTFVAESCSQYLINEIRYTVIHDSLVINRTNRNQTEVLIGMYNENLIAGGYTGIIENERNVWIHPPRSNFFKVLNTCPYPYVQLPLYIGKKWSDKMKISDHWADPKWATWEKKLHMDLSYEVIGKESINVNDKEYECFIVNSVANSKIGKCKLLFYFNKQLGFIKMKYDILGKIAVNFDLMDVK